MAAALLGLLALSGTAWTRSRPRPAAALILAAATLLGWGWQLALLELTAEGALRTLLSRTLSRTITSYHTAALSPEARDPLAFLRHHAVLLADFRTTAKHAATHPPGPVLFYRGLIALCDASPRLTRLTLAALGEGDERPSRPPNTTASRAAALIGALLLGLLGAATAWPVAALAGHVTGDPLAAARVGVLWSLLPGPALMTPQFDQALALPVAAAAALMTAAVSGGRVVLQPLLAGLCGGLALLVSYGAAVFLLIGGAAALALGRGNGARQLSTVAGMAGAGAAAVIGLTALLGHEPLRSALTALAIHREVYTTPRSYLLWLVFGPLDLALFLGPPIAILLALRAGRCWAAPARPVDWMRRGVIAGLALLVLSGATRGEVGRIWIPLMPFLLVAALAGPRAAGGKDDGPGVAEALALALLLVPLCIVIRLYWTL